MGLLTHNSTPAERARGCVFAEKFESSDAVVRNGGTIASAPVIDFGITYDGVDDDVTYAADQLFGQSEVSILVEFTPDFDFDADLAAYLFRAGPTAGELYSIDKAPNAGSNVLTIVLGGTAIAAIASATYGPYWLDGQRNVLVVSGTSGNTNAWLNGTQILTASATAWTPAAPDTLYANYLEYFDGVQHSLKIFTQALTAQEAADYYNNETYTYENECSLYLPMGADQHDPTNVRTLDVSDNDRHATFADGATAASYPTKIGRHHGYTFDGTDDYLAGAGTSIFGGSVTVAIGFTPAFAPSYDGNEYFFDTTSGSQFYLVKENNAASNVLSLMLGDTAIASIAQATYEPYWKTNGNNLIVIAGTDGATSVWLNGSIILNADNTSWASADPANYYLGQDQSGTDFFEGDINLFRVWASVLTLLQIHDLTIRTLGKVNDV